MARGNLSGWPFPRRPKPVLSTLNAAANKDVLEDVNVEKLISLVQGCVCVQENASIINTDLMLKE